MSKERIDQMVQQFFAQAIDYQELTLENLAAFVGMDLQSLLAVFSRQQWKKQRDAWVLQRLRQAMDEIYQAAKTQDDFSVKRVAERAGVDNSRLHRLAKDEFLQRKATLPVEHITAEFINQLAEQFFAQAATYQELSLEHFTRLVGLDPRTRSRMLSRKQWNTLKEAWLFRHLQEAMDEIYQTAKIQTDFSARRIARRVGIDYEIVSRSEEFQRLRATLPSAKERVLAVIKAMVDANTPLADFTSEKILEAAGTSNIYHTDYKWFIEARLAAYLELAQHHQQPISVLALPSGGEYKLFAGAWVDLNSDCWTLPTTNGKRHLLRRDRLREDFAGVAWSVLREELRSGEIEVTTLVSHYQGFLQAGRLLGIEIPDFRLSCLEALQRAWVQYDGTPPMRREARIALLQLIETLINRSENNRDANKVEMLRMATWLGMVVAIPNQKPGETFLSENELTKLLQGCLADIENGIAFTEDDPDLLLMSTTPIAKINAAPVVQWGTALMVLVMAFTGLRRQSVLQLEIHDWIQIRTGLFALMWHHGKKREENLAVLPAEVAFHLDLYVRRTASVRAALRTEHVFLNGSFRKYWCDMSEHAFSARLNELAERHHLERNGTPMLLGSTIFRRTFATHALAEGRSLWALRAQLGHTGIRTTFKYAKVDRYEQPDQLRGPLDAYARQSLTLWHTPLLLNNLAPAERSRLLGTKVYRQQDVGLCRHDYCVKAERGSPPPCSLCEHLVTGFEFLAAWEREQVQREQELQRLAATPQSELVFAQMKCQFEQFQVNLAFVQENCGS
jgi:integrase